MNKVLIIAIAVISISISAQTGFASPTLTGSQIRPITSVVPSYLSVIIGGYVRGD